MGCCATVVTREIYRVRVQCCFTNIKKTQCMYIHVHVYVTLRIVAEEEG